VTVSVSELVVFSGAEAGAFYVRQLLRAVAAGRLRTRRIVVVDRDPACAARGFSAGLVELATTEWSQWLDRELLALPGDAQLVPYHWAPHLLLDWLAGEVRRAGASAERIAALPRFGLPFEQQTRAGDRALSYASWPCPPACIEPALCPHTRGRKDWSLARDLEATPPGLDASLVFRSLHLVYGVASIPVAEIRAARERVLAGLDRQRLYAVGTASHCHGLVTALAVRPCAPLSQDRTAGGPTR
jgi:hypothetical protein